MFGGTFALAKIREQVDNEMQAYIHCPTCAEMQAYIHCPTCAEMRYVTLYDWLQRAQRQYFCEIHVTTGGKL